MVVIADTSPLNYVILIGRAAVLPALFCEVVIPPAVFEELQRERAPRVVREFVQSRPDWLLLAGRIPEQSEVLAEEAFDDGEREAIALAEASGDDVSHRLVERLLERDRVRRTAN